MFIRKTELTSSQGLKVDDSPRRKSNSTDRATTPAGKWLSLATNRFSKLTHVLVVDNLSLVQPRFRVPFLHEMLDEVFLRARQALRKVPSGEHRQ